MRADRNIGQIVRNQIGTELVALVDRGPQFFRGRIPGQTVRIAQALGELARVGVLGQVLFPDRRAALFHFHPTFADIRGGANGHVKAVAIGAEHQVAHPVVARSRQVHHLARLASNGRFAQLVVKYDHGIVVGNVEPVIVPGEAGGRGQVPAFDQGKALFGHTIAIAITQQHQPVRGFAMRSGALHQALCDPADQPATRI